MRNIILNFIILLCIFSCNTTKNSSIIIDGKPFVSVKEWGAKGNALTDDVTAIQKCFDNFENVYFPRGSYLIATAYNGTYNPHSLLITEKSKVRNIVFDSMAELVIREDFRYNNINKNTIIKIVAKEGNINHLTINGLTIKAINENYSTEHSGVFAIEKKGSYIKDLKLLNVRLENLSGNGILTYASKTKIQNLITKNTKGHGVGALNPYNQGKEHYLFIDGYLSENDQAYTIDFSGTSVPNHPQFAMETDKWTGYVKNITSLNSKRGIKTAGYWNLHLENINIINPSIYGFFINKDAPGRKIIFKNMTIMNAGEQGLSLSGKTHFEGENLSIINCKKGLTTIGTTLNLKNVIIEGNNSEMGLRFQNSGVIDSFKISGIKEEYAPIWITGAQCTLKNGIIDPGQCPYGILVHEKALNTKIDNVMISQSHRRKYDYFILQKSGKIKITNKNIGSRSEDFTIKNNSGIKIIH